MGKMWVSPDSRITKDVLESGEFGAKPTENSLCEIKITEIKSENIISEYINEISETNPKIIIGDANTALDREIDKLLLTMSKGELSLVTINIPQKVEVSFQIKLEGFESRGLFYQWTAEEKCKMALNHKEKGVELFRNGRFIDASHRFSKGLKLLISIPVPVDDTPEKIEHIPLADIQSYKANLYNNLASCYSKENRNDVVIELCSKVLELDKDNLKALCKRGYAFSGNKDYEKAKYDLLKVLEMDSDNKAALEKMQYINSNLNKQEADYATIVKKMFSK